MNGTTIPAYYWIQEANKPCEMLAPIHINGVHASEENGLLMSGCMLHNVEQKAEDQIKPVHCMSDPQSRPLRVKSKRGERLVYSRRHYSRNHQWPGCPVDLDVFPVRSDFQSDKTVWQKKVERWKHLDGCKIEEGFALWQDLVGKTLNGKPPTETIYFEDYF